MQHISCDLGFLLSQAILKVLASRPVVNQTIQPFNKESLWVYACKKTYADFLKTDLHSFCEG